MQKEQTKPKRAEHMGSELRDVTLPRRGKGWTCFGLGGGVLAPINAARRGGEALSSFTSPWVAFIAEVKIATRELHGCGLQTCRWNGNCEEFGTFFFFFFFVLVRFCSWRGGRGGDRSRSSLAVCIPMISRFTYLSIHLSGGEVSDGDILYFAALVHLSSFIYSSTGGRESGLECCQR